MEQKGDFRALTSLKGLFILLIAVHNTLSVTPLFSNIPGSSFIILFGGALGNSMFFILSGFLLSGGYRDRIQSHTISFGQFLLRRLKKLYPMYIISNFAAFLVEIARYGVSAVNVEKLIFTVLLQGGGGIGTRSPYNSPTWFLSALFVCYIVFFAISFFAKSYTHYVSYLTLGVILGYTLISANLWIPFFRMDNGIAYMNFFLGCIFAEVYPRIPGKLHRWLQPLFLVLVPVLAYLLLSYGVTIIAGDVHVCFAFVICPMILYLALVKGPCSGILRFKWFVALGKISSAVFFWHLVIYFAFCEVYTLVTGGSSVEEPQYILYFLLMTVISAAFSKMEETKRSAGKKQQKQITGQGA